MKNHENEFITNGYGSPNKHHYRIEYNGFFTELSTENAFGLDWEIAQLIESGENVLNWHPIKSINSDAEGLVVLKREWNKFDIIPKKGVKK